MRYELAKRLPVSYKLVIYTERGVMVTLALWKGESQFESDVLYHIFL